MTKRFASLLTLTLVTGLLPCCGAADDADTAQIEQTLPREGSGGYTCTVEQCNGNLNPFGHCSHSVNGVCLECIAGGHVGRCSGNGPCQETNCPPTVKAQ